MSSSEANSSMLPEIGSDMFLVLGENVNFRSRLESIDGDQFSVAAPLETAGPAMLGPGFEFDVFWVPPRTRVVLPCRLVTVSDTVPLRWTLKPMAPARHSNRREFVRGGAGAPVRLFAAESDRPVEAVLLDISEGGLRCWIDEPVSIAQGDELRAVAWLGSEEADLVGKVHTVRAAPHGDPGQHLILTFDTQEDIARVIRQYIMNWEINERRAAAAAPR